ncbi:hypothetical protein DEU56DRAFT_740460, partial [Suillus clintonianus]|uniref:uncharacterized protein n=1 Tax=Suillus clintonianus TaxID=1904413 RepID=UPI001B881D4D
SVKWTRNQLFLRSRMLQKTRGVNSWNAFVKARLKDENEGQCRGDRTKLTAFIAENKATLLRDYRKLTFAEKQAYNACVLEDRQEKNRTARSNPKAVKHDVNAAFTSMDREVHTTTNTTEIYPQWMGLHARTGLEGFYVAVRGGIEDLAEPKIFFTEKSQKFVRDVLGIEPQHLGLKLEAFVISKLDEHVTLNRQRPLNKLISECRELIQDNLEFILMEKNVSGKVKMNYTNYERAIVERHGVELTKWPLPGGVKNPSKAGGRAQVQVLLNALKSDSCKWVSLSDKELVKRMKDNRDRHARGEQVYVQRKARARISQPKSKATVNTDDELSSSSSSSSDSDSD